MYTSFLKGKLLYCELHCSVKNHVGRKTEKYSLSKCMLRHDVVRVFVSFLVLVIERAILSWCP